MEKEVRMRLNQQWADQPETKINSQKRPNLRLIVSGGTSNSEASPETPIEKAVQSVSPTTEVVLVVLAQGILVLGLFWASNVMS